MNTKAIIQIGIALILLGISTLAYQGATYTHYASLVETNIAQSSGDRVISLSPLTGVLLLAGGIVLVAVGVKKSARRHLKI